MKCTVLVMVGVHEHETHVDFINLNANTENCSEMTKGMFSRRILMCLKQ